MQKPTLLSVEVGRNNESRPESLVAAKTEAQSRENRKNKALLSHQLAYSIAGFPVKLRSGAPGMEPPVIGTGTA